MQELNQLKEKYPIGYTKMLDEGETFEIWKINFNLLDEIYTLPCLLTTATFNNEPENSPVIKMFYRDEISQQFPMHKVKDTEMLFLVSDTESEHQKLFICFYYNFLWYSVTCNKEYFKDNWDDETDSVADQQIYSQLKMFGELVYATGTLEYNNQLIALEKEFQLLEGSIGLEDIHRKMTDILNIKFKEWILNNRELAINHVGRNFKFSFQDDSAPYYYIEGKDWMCDTGSKILHWIDNNPDKELNIMGSPYIQGITTYCSGDLFFEYWVDGCVFNSNNTPNEIIMHDLKHFYEQSETRIKKIIEYYATHFFCP